MPGLADRPCDYLRVWTRYWAELACIAVYGSLTGVWVFAPSGGRRSSRRRLSQRRAGLQQRRDGAGTERARAGDGRQIAFLINGEETATDGVVGQEQAGRLSDFSRKLNSLALARTKKRDFWRHPADQADFAKEITVALITDGICQPEQAPALADKLTEIIRANKAYLQSQD